jgi:hypothetical protein
MAIQNAISMSNRITKKKYFYDSSLEKGIVNSVTVLGRDSSMDNEDYKDSCFCPTNNKLYLVRTNSSSNAGFVDIVCPNATTQTQSPQASVAVGNYANLILYCPSVRRIFAMAPTKISIIDPRNNTIESEITMASSWSPACAAYNPRVNKIYIGSSNSSVITVVDPGKISNSGIVTGAKEETEIKSILNSLGYGAITGLRTCPERNILYLFDGNQSKSSGVSVHSNHIQISVNKNNIISYAHVLSAHDWLEPDHKTKDVIYCPFDGASYWLSSSGESGELIPLSRVFRMDMTNQSPTPTNPAPPVRSIDLNRNYEKLVYCPDNNMIYVLGSGGMQMINPADSFGVRPVTEFFDDSLSINTNGVSYSPVNNRIYGVGDSGYVKYINPTT